MKRPLDRDSLEQLFREIDKELSEPLGIHLVVVAGAALIFAGLNRATRTRKGKETSGALAYLVEEAYGRDALDNQVREFIHKVAEMRENESG